MTDKEFIEIVKKIKKPSKWIMFKTWWLFFWNCTILRKNPQSVLVYSIAKHSPLAKSFRKKKTFTEKPLFVSIAEEAESGYVFGPYVEITASIPDDVKKFYKTGERK